MTIEEIIAKLKELQTQQQSGASGGSAAPASAASVPASATSGGTQLGTLINPALGINTGPSSAEGGQIGGDIGSVLGLLFGPAGSALGGLGGGLLGDVLGGAIGGGVPTAAKSTALGTALDTSGSGIDALIGKFIGKEVNSGNVLSQSDPSNAENDVRRFAAIVEALTGQRGPSVTATGFNNNPTWNNPGIGKAIKDFRIPAGYQFSSDPSKLGDIYKDVSGSIGLQSTGIKGPGSGEEWQRIVRELIQQGALTKYQGPLGAAGGGNTSGGAIPNVSLPHPLAQNQQQLTQAPYPV